MTPSAWPNSCGLAKPARELLDTAIPAHGSGQSRDQRDRAEGLRGRPRARVALRREHGERQGQTAPMARTPTACNLRKPALAGVPYLIKDLGAAVAGPAHDDGQPSLSPLSFPTDDAPVSSPLAKAAGLNIFGKTSTSELGQHALYGARTIRCRCRNPWNLDHTPGGSSGGAAAADRGGHRALAHASDGGGSIRIPASCCRTVRAQAVAWTLPHAPPWSRRGELGRRSRHLRAACATARCCSTCSRATRTVRSARRVRFSARAASRANR